MLLQMITTASADDARDTQYSPITSGLTTNVNKQIFSSSQTSSTNPVGTMTWPTITGVTANYAVDGQITMRTSMVNMTTTGTFSAGTYKSGIFSTSPYSISSARPALFIPSLTSSGQGDQMNSGTVSSINFNTTTGIVLWMQILGTGPYYLGVTTNITYPSKRSADFFAFGQINKAILYPLAPSVTTTVGSGVKDTDTTITGKGTFEGDVITSDVSSATATVNSDLTYTLNVGSLKGKSDVTVTETGTKGVDTPGTKKVSVTHVPDLSVSTTTNALTLSPDDYTSVSAMSDTDAVAWLVKQAGITAVDKNNDNSSDGITFASSQTGIGAKIAALGIGDSMTIPIHAVLGSTNSADVAIVVTRSAGMITFETVSDAVDFGTTEVPNKPTTLPLATPLALDVSDTRATGSRWGLMASASSLSNEDGKELPGGIVFNDGSSSTPLTDETTTIATGTKAAGQNTFNIASSWSGSKGIFLQVSPGVYAGSEYFGTIRWILNESPEE
ncbi:hypothetical protein ACRYI5_05710 [Furfurilactobacillus sp. WILCCON 0119]